VTRQQLFWIGVATFAVLAVLIILESTGRIDLIPAAAN
jgi:hypothetical protein